MLPFFQLSEPGAGFFLKVTKKVNADYPIPPWIMASDCG
jgi:hypothetical protein